MSAMDPGCVKTHLGQGRSELFSNCSLPAGTCQYDWFPWGEIELEILRTSSASKFSHSLGQKATCPPRNPASGLPFKADFQRQGLGPL